MSEQEIGRYRYNEQPLARDAFGSVHAGEDTQTGAAVLVKEMHGHRVSEQARSRIQALMGLKSEALAALHDSVRLDRAAIHVAVLPFEGNLLAACFAELRQGSFLGRFQLLRNLIDVCRGAEDLHRSGLVHGAINPTSVLIRQDTIDEAVLLCFEPFDPHPTGDYLLDADNLIYLAQEQIRGDGEGPSPDIYAIGMLLYVGFGAVPPFDASDVYQLAEQVVFGDVPPFRPYVDDLDPELASAIMPDLETIGAVAIHALQRSPLARYAAVGDMLRPLEQIAARLEPMALARSLYLNDQFEIAALACEEAAKLPTHAEEANILLGRIYGMELNNFDRARTAYRRALHLNPDLETPRLGLARLYSRFGEHKLAKRELEELMQRCPNDTQIMMDYAQVLQQGGNFAGALNVLRRIQSLSPYFLPAYIAAIRLSRESGTHKEAMVDCDQAVQRISDVVKLGNLDPGQVAEVYYQRGMLLYEGGRISQARNWLLKSLDYWPSHSHSRQMMARILAEQGDIETALQHLMVGLSLQPNQEGIMEMISQILGVTPQ